MPRRDYYRVGQLVKARKKRLWSNPNQVLCIKKRKAERFYYVKEVTGYSYFVTALDAPAGHGAWLDHNELTSLTPLEQLASVMK